MKKLDHRFTPYRDIKFEERFARSTGIRHDAVLQRWGLLIIVGTSHGWDHVSVSRRDRTPTWEEMERVKRWLFENNETAMQLHVPPSDHINVHGHALHIWRPQNTEIPRPPSKLV
jgi:hypothetical protein